MRIVWLNRMVPFAATSAHICYRKLSNNTIYQRIKLATKDDRTMLLKMKERGCIRDKEVARSWSEMTWQFDPVSYHGGCQWMRVVTEPSIIGDGGVALGRSR